MRKPQAALDFERLLRQEILATEYWESLKREAEAEVKRAMYRGQQKSRATA
jgi:hypothetical protein